MQPSTAKRGSGTHNKRLWIAAAVLAVFVIVLFFTLNVWLSRQMNQTEFTTSTRQLEIIIGNDVVRTPANYVRFARQRDEATANQLNLVFLYPETSGYSQQKKTDFNAAGNNSSLIHLTLRKRELSHDMSGRLQPIYTQLFEGTPQAGPEGLTMQPLRAGSGYNGEVLAIGQYNQKNWVARCQTPESNMRPVCIRDVFVGRELSALYSFPLHMLKDWKDIESTTQNFLKDIIFE